MSYTVGDGRGSARGTLTVYVQDDAPLKAPIAQITSWDYDAALRTVRRPSIVLENDEDPDGSIDEVTDHRRCRRDRSARTC